MARAQRHDEVQLLKKFSTAKGADIGAGTPDLDGGWPVTTSLVCLQAQQLRQALLAWRQLSSLAMYRAARGSPRQDSDSKRARESSEDDVAPALPRYTLRQQPELEAEHQQRQQEAQQQQQRQKHQQAAVKAAEQQESGVRAAEQELAMRSAERQRQQQQETLEDSLRTGGPLATAMHHACLLDSRTPSWGWHSNHAHGPP